MADLRVARAYARRIEPSAWSLGALVHEVLMGNQLNLISKHIIATRYFHAHVVRSMSAGSQVGHERRPVGQ